MKRDESKNNRLKSSRITLIGFVVSVVILLGCGTIVVLGSLAPTSDNLEKFQGWELKVAKEAVRMANVSSGPTIVPQRHSVLTVAQTDLGGRCNTDIGTGFPSNIQTHPIQRYAVTLKEIGITGIFSGEFILYVCIY